MAENGDFHEPSPKILKISEEPPSSISFLKVKKLSPNAILPSRGSSLAPGYDLSSAAEVKVPARGKALFPTDLSIAVPKDTYAQIAPRSGLTWKHSIDVGAGVIDADYRGPLGVILFNHSDLDFEVKPGDRIAQMIIQKIITPDVELDDLDSNPQNPLPNNPFKFRAAMAENGDLHEPSPKILKISEEAPSSINFLKVKKLSPNAILPSRGSALAAGYDLSSAAEVKVPARGKARVPTDLSITIPKDTHAQIAPRSGLTWKHSIDVGAGVISADYRGPLDVILFNHSDLDFEVKPGDRIAQLIIQKIITPDVELDNLDSNPQNSLSNNTFKSQAAMAENDDLDLHEPSPSNVNFLKVKKLSPDAILPSRGSSLAAGYDLSSVAEVKVPARGKALIPTDLSIAIPKDTYARIASRLGLTWKHSIDVGAGFIEVDYSGTLGVILFNHSDLDFEVKPGDRIAQLIIQKIITPDVFELDDLDSTVRGSDGFGSTGVSFRN